MNEITLTKPSELQVVNASPEQAAQSFIQMAMERGTAVSEMTELVKVWKEMVDDARKVAFDRAMAEFRANCPPIPLGRLSRFKHVNTAGAKVDKRYSDMLDIVKTINPILKSLDLHYEFEKTDAVMIGNEIHYQAHVRIRHGGYSEVKIGSPVALGKPVPGQSPQEHVSSVTTWAQRLALKAAFGLWSADQNEEDAAIEAAETETITEAQADELIALLADYNAIKGDKATAGLEKAMLAAVGVVSMQAIPAAKFAGVVKTLVGHVEKAKAGAK